MVDYGLLRLVQQSLFFLALPIVIVFDQVFGWARWSERVRSGVIASDLALIFLVLSGLLPALTGGYKGTLATSNDGLYYQAYYTPADELDAFTWLAAQAPSGSVVQTDEFTRRQVKRFESAFKKIEKALGYRVIKHIANTSGITRWPGAQY